MADGIGDLRIVENRRFEDYRSLKQAFQHRHTKEILCRINQTSTAAAAELMEAGGQAHTYLAAEGNGNVRAEGVDTAGCRAKDMYLEYLDHAGDIQTATVATAGDSTTETVIAADYESTRMFYSTTEAVADHQWWLCNDAGNAFYQVIQDGRKYAATSHYRAPNTATCRAFLGRVKITATKLQTDAADSSYQLTIAYTPKDRTNITETIDFWDILDYQPCVEIEPLTSVTFKIKKFTDANHKEVLFESSILEVYPTE